MGREERRFPGAFQDFLQNFDFVLAGNQKNYLGRQIDYPSHTNPLTPNEIFATV